MLSCVGWHAIGFGLPCVWPGSISVSGSIWVGGNQSGKNQVRIFILNVTAWKSMIYKIIKIDWEYH